MGPRCFKEIHFFPVDYGPNKKIGYILSHLVLLAFTIREENEVRKLSINIYDEIIQ